MTDDLLNRADGFRLGTGPTDDDVDRANSLISNMTARIRELEAGVAGEASDTCKNCAGGGWVCENHRDRPWNSDGCECGAGAPCPICQWEHATAGTIGSAVWPDELRAEADRRQKRGQGRD